MLRPAALLAAALLLGGCGHVVNGFDFAERHDCAPAPPLAAHRVEVRYLGSGGVAITWKGETILLGPSFSNPSIFRAGLGHPKPDVGRIDRGLEHVETGRVKAVFAGHSHYDHVVDFPQVAERLPAGTPFWVNAAGMKMLHAVPSIAAHQLGETPIDVTPSIRVTPVRSSHAPQLCRWRIGPCIYAGGRMPDAPWAAGSWNGHRLRDFRRGETYALAITLLDGGVERFRIYYNDASPDAGRGEIDGPFDLAILCIAQWNWARGYPDALLARLRARRVIVSHWENFFCKETGRAHFVPHLSDRRAAAFLARVDAGALGGAEPQNAVCGVTTEKWTMPVVGTAVQFEVR